MYPFFETIRVDDGIPCHLEYHQERLVNTMKANYLENSLPSLSDIFLSAELPETGLYKCRVEYNNISYRLTFEAYVPKTVQTLKIVDGDNIEYPFKYTDRSALTRLLSLKGDCDDILIIKNGKVTDTSYTNIAFFNGIRWYTPESFLLPGTARARLLETGILETAPIGKDDIRSFKSFKLINSMLNTDFSDSREIEGIVF